MIMIQGKKVLDMHCHFPNTGEWFPGYNLHQIIRKDMEITWEQTERFRKAFDFPEGNDQYEDKEAADRWYNDIVEKEVEKVTFVSGGGNDRLAKIVSYHPDRFYGFAHHHPFSENAADELERAIRDLGMKGYKILGPAVDKPLSDRSLYPLWEVAKQYDIPVLVHFGILGAAGGLADAENISPFAIHDVARDFPTVKFVIPHFGAGYPTELLHLCWACPNIYVDTSGSNQWVRWMAYDLSLKDLYRRFYETIGPERIIFSSDSHTLPRGFSKVYLVEHHKIMQFLRFSDEEMEKILYRNAAMLLKEE